MFRFNWMFLFILLILVTTSCSNQDEQKIMVQRFNPAENNYEDYKEIADAKKVSTARKILHNAKWTNAKVDMSREADYRFVFQYINPALEAKAALYSIWISPNQDTLEVVQGGNQYVHLNKDDSERLYEVITELNLSSIK